MPRQETITRTIYTARELKDANPRGFERALERHREWVYSDPAWASEHRESLGAAIAAFGDPDELPNIEGPRRVMAWVENNILSHLRISWTGDERKRLRQFGASYRPGMLRPCPWTGYYVDDDLLETIIKEARDGETPRRILREVKERADALWEKDVDFQTTEEAFIDDAEANEREFYENGELA